MLFGDQHGFDLSPEGDVVHHNSLDGWRPQFQQFEPVQNPQNHDGKLQTPGSFRPSRAVHCPEPSIKTDQRRCRAEVCSFKTLGPNVTLCSPVSGLPFWSTRWPPTWTRAGTASCALYKTRTRQLEEKSSRDAGVAALSSIAARLRFTW